MTTTSAGAQTGESSSSSGVGGGIRSVTDLAPEIAGGTSSSSKPSSSSRKESASNKKGTKKIPMAHTTVFLGFRDDFDLTEL
jgi:hypothetical protein